MLKLHREGNVVTCDGKVLTINAQASKGEGNEVVKIEGLEGSNGQKWISLARIKEGDNEFECQGREVTVSKKYELTEKEAKQVADLQAKIDVIVNAAKARYVAKPKLATPAEVEKMTPEQKAELAAQIKAYYGL